MTKRIVLFLLLIAGFSNGIAFNSRLIGLVLSLVKLSVCICLFRRNTKSVFINILYKCLYYYIKTLLKLLPIKKKGFLYLIDKFVFLYEKTEKWQNTTN